MTRQASNEEAITQSAAQTLAKVVTSKTGTAGAYAVGDVVTYTITQTNTGNVTLNNVVITDDEGHGKSTTSGKTGSCASVAPSATCVLEGTYTITQTEKDAGTFKNTASVKSTEIPTALETSNTITLAANAKPTLSKALTSNADEDKTSTITVGDTLTYTVTLLNDGDVTITDTTITDDKISPSSASCSSVAVNGTCVLTGTYKVTQADVDAGKVVNNAASTSKNPAGTTLTRQASNEEAITRSVELAVVKTASSTGSSVGDVITYTIEIKNTGNVTVKDLVLTDTFTDAQGAALALTTGPSFVKNSGASAEKTLAPGETATYTATYAITQAAIDAGGVKNVALVAGTDPLGTKVEDTSDNGDEAEDSPGDTDEDPTNDPTETPLAPAPSLVVQKTASSTGSSVGDVITYTIEIKNTGNVTVKDLVLTDTFTDAQGAALALTTGPSFVKNSGASAEKTLAPGETATYTATYAITQAAIDAGGVKNVALVAGTDPLGTKVEDTSDNGDEAEDSPGDTDEDPTNDPTETPLAPAPSLVVQKTASSTGSSVGDVITYTIEIKNTGNVTVKDLVLTDTFTDAQGAALALTTGPSFVKNSGASAEKTLAPGETATYTATYAITQAAIDAGGVKNVALVAGTDPLGTKVEDTSDNGDEAEDSPGDTDEDPTNDPTETPLTGEPSQTISKRVSENADEDASGDISLNDTLTYTVTATNIGNLTLSNLVVADEQLEPKTITCERVEPGQGCTLAGILKVTQAHVDAGFIDNIATVTSQQIPEKTQTDLRTMVPRRPALAISKTVSAASTAEIVVGDELSYTVLATNVGNQTLSDVTVNDTMILPSSIVCAVLAPNDSCELSGVYVVTQADKDAGDITNVASVVSVELPKPLETTLITPLVQNFQPTLSKVLSRLTDRDENGGISAGDLLTFTVSLLNDGDATLTQVLLSDDRVSPSSASCAKVLPGSSCKLVGSYKVTQADVDAGNLVNIALASMKEHPEGRKVVLNTPLTQVTELALDKEFIEHIDIDGSGDLNSGDALSYRITAQNTGNVTLTNVRVTDEILLPSEAVCAEVGPGDTCVLSGRYTVLVTDITAGVVVNKATADADNLADPVLAETKVPLEQNQAPTLTKVLVSNDDRDVNGSVTPGDVLTYRVTLLNDGNATLTNAVVTDPLIEPSAKTCATLLPGKSCDLVGTYLVTFADQQAGIIENFAEATTTEVPGPRQASLETIVEEPLADLSLTKTVNLSEDKDGSTTLTPGDVVEFVITITNEVTDIPTGDATGVVVFDKLQSRYGYLSDDGAGLYDPVVGDWTVGTVRLGESKQLRISALVLSTGSFTNTAEVTGSNSIDPDSFPGNDDGDQDEDDEAASPPSPTVGLSVEVGTPVPRGNGNYTIPMSYVIENTGIVGLCDLKILDDLGAVFGSDRVVSVTTPVTAGTLVPNPNFDGVTDLNLLISDCDNADASRLPADSDAVVKIIVEVTPTPDVTRYEHNARVEAKSSDIGSPSVQIPIFDLSTDGPEPDPNKNNNAEEDAPNIIELQLLPEIDVDIRASVPVLQPTGEYLTVLGLTVLNQGNLSLTDIDLSLPLSEVFLNGYRLAGPVTVDRGSIVVNNQFDGGDRVGLFDADASDGISSHLAVGELVNAEVPVIFESNSQASFELSAMVSAQASVGAVSDRSLDDVAAGLDKPAVISTTPIGTVGVALSASPAAETIVAKDPSERCEVNPCQASLTLKVENVGNLALSGIQVEPLLSGPDGLPEGTVVSITDLSAEAGLSLVNQGVVGQSFVIGGEDVIQLLAGTETLAIGGRASIRLALRFTLPAGTLFERFDIAALASGLDTEGVRVSDLSNNGSSVDLAGDGPNDDGIATPLVISSQSIIGVLAQAKSDSAGNVITLLDGGDPEQDIEARTLTYGAGFQVEVANLGNTALEAVEVVNSLVGTFPTLAADPKQPLSVVPGSISVTKTTSDPVDPAGLSQKRDGKVQSGIRRKTDLANAVNLNFDGIRDVNLVNADQVTLALGETIVIRYDLEIKIDYANEAAIQELQQQNFETQIVANGTDSESGQTISDLSDDAPGIDLDALDFNELRDALDGDGDFDPNEAGENTPTALQFPTAIQGKVCLDMNADGGCTEIDTPLEGWTVNVFEAGGQSDPAPQTKQRGVTQKPLLNAAGEPISVLTDANGYYSIASAPTGSYRFDFESPYGVVAGTVNGTGFSLKVLNVPTLVLDPRGLIYDSVTGDPIGGVMLTLADAQGIPLPAACFSVPAQQNQITGSADVPGLLGLPAGAYEFSIQPGAATECPVESTRYQILLDAETLPEGYARSSLRPPEVDALIATPDRCSASGVNVDTDPETTRCEVSKGVVPEVGEGLPPYYLSFEIEEGAVEFVNNHIPLDPPIDGLVLLTKASVKDTVMVGDLAPYTVRVENLTQYPLLGLELVDTQAPGFALADGSLRLTRAGEDGLLGTEDDQTKALGFMGGRPISLESFNLLPRETVMISYVMRVGAGVERGLLQNVVVPLLADQMVGNRAQASIEVVADPLFDLTAFIGKVFADQNENGTQDDDEIGLPGVRIATVGGEWITTDRHGRFSLPGIDPGKNSRGRNAILKVDPASLPSGSRFTTENPRVLRITGGLMNQFDFGVKLPDVAPVPPQSFKTQKVTKTTIERILDPVRFASGQFQISDQYVQQLKGALKQLQGVANLRIVLEGHTDNQALSSAATERYGDNLGLSAARATAVATFLSEALGLSIDQFVTQGYGDQRPAVSNASAEGMALNRRVEIRLAYDVTEAEQITTTTGKTARIVMGDRYFDGSDLRPIAFPVFDGIKDALTDPAMLNLVLVIPTGSEFVSRRALILAYFHGLEGLSEVQVQKLIVSSTKAEHQDLSRASKWLTRWVLLALNTLIPPVFADTDVTCLSPSLCSGKDLMIYVSEAAQAPVATLGPQGLSIGEQGAVWISKQPGQVSPRFVVRAPETLQVEDSGLVQPAEFWMDTNFPDQITSWTLKFFAGRDGLRKRAIAEVTGEGIPIGTPVIWEGNLLEGRLMPGSTLAYSLTLLGVTGDEIEVRGGIIHLQLPAEDAPEVFAFDDLTWFEEIESENHLVSTDLNLTGDLVTLHAANLPVGATMMLGDARYPVGQTGQLMVDRQLPPGDYRLPIAVLDPSDAVLGRYELPVTVEGDYFFMVGLADFTTGKHDVSGNIELLNQDAHYDGDVYVDGRLAFYLKGQIQGKYLITAQLDTGEDDIGAVFSDIDRNDPRRLFKRIDPDRLYPVYGDDSRVTRDVDTQGKFYVRLDWDRSKVLWGNYNTGMSGTELSAYNRSLYGFKLDYRSSDKTELNEDRHTFKTFVSEPNTKAARDELIGTGGSLYYLSHSDLVLGSAKLMVEVRDRLSGRVREQIELIEGQDYEIDPFQGRVILSRPLRSTANLSVLSIIRQAPLDGDEVVLIADYEYITTGFSGGEDVTAGVRGKTWLGDHIAVGGTYVSEADDGAEFEIKGVDVTFKAAERSYLVIEQSETRAGQDLAFNQSSDGGLGYQALSLPGAVMSGQALSVTGQIDLEDLGAAKPGQVGFWYRNQDAGFNSLAFNQASGNDLMTYGVETALTLTETVALKARFDHEERGSDATYDDGGIQLDWQASDRFRLAGEYLKQRDDLLGTVDNSSTLGVRLSFDVNDRLSSFVNAQSVLEQSRNSQMEDLMGVGFDYRATQKTSLTGEVFSDGEHDGARLGFGYRYRDNSAAYLNYVTERGDLTRDGLTLGHKTEITDRMSVYSEHRFDQGGRQNVEGNSYGLSYRFTDAWTVDGDILMGETQGASGGLDQRSAYSLSSRYRDERLNVVNRLEFRVDDSAAGADRDQWVSTNRLQYRYSNDWVVVGKADYSKALEKTTEFIDARFAEVDLGLAYRPVAHNKLNLLAMVSYVYDVDPSNQMGGLYVDEKGRVLSLEGLYQLTDRLKLGGKVAVKRSAIRLDRNQDDFISATTTLWIARLRYHMVWKLDALVEYRKLEIDEIGDRKQGALLGLDLQLGPNMAVGVGYNFTDFNDRLTNLDYESKGWFLNLNGRL